MGADGVIQHCSLNAWQWGFVALGFLPWTMTFCMLLSALLEDDFGHLFWDGGYCLALAVFCLVMVGMT